MATCEASTAAGLAFAGRIESLSPIEGADRIELAEAVCGAGGRWCGVVGKGQFSRGDDCTVYLQDAVVKPCEHLAFLERTQWRVKMARFRGAPSECVIVAPTDGAACGDDLTSRLGVTKYEKPVPVGMQGDAVGSFPAFIPKTDEPNFQTAGRLVEALRGKPWHATVKVDGSSATAFRLGDRFGVCSRNLELKEWHANAYWRVALAHDLRDKLPDGIAIQWETAGPGIQKNPLGLKEVIGLAFNAWDINLGAYLDHADFLALCSSLGFPTVEIAASGHDFQPTSDGLRELAEGTYPNGKQREGIVIRPNAEERVNGDRLSFKVINLLYKD